MKGEKLYLAAVVFQKRLYEFPGYVTGVKRMNVYNKYLNLIRKAAYLGHVEAQYDYAQEFENMNHLSVNNPLYNPQKCIYWYTKASKKNHPAACNNLATFYETGTGCKKNLRKALSLYKKSGKLGDPLGKRNYRIMLRQREKLMGDRG